MAQRRMFSMHIMDSDAFLDMPPTAQNLYMHMSMRADDDGFVSNPKKISRMIGSGDDDMRILLGKKFIIPFESGICVIKHWRIHNYIQKDRYQPTKYIEEMALLKVKDNGGYTLDTECVQNGDTGKVRLGKSEVSLDKEIEGELTVSLSTYGEFNNVKLAPSDYLKLVDQYGEGNTNALIEELSGYIASSGKRYKSHYATLLSWARRKLQERKDKVTSKGKAIIGL